MNHHDEHLRSILKNSVKDICFSELQKERIQQNISRELKQRRLSLWQKAIASLKAFWEAAYEISLAPVVMSAAVVLLVAGTAFYGYYISPELASPQSSQTSTLYLRQTVTNPDGGMQVVYVPVKRGS